MAAAEAAFHYLAGAAHGVHRFIFYAWMREYFAGVLSRGASSP
jgi:hypothetical protein